MAAHKMKSTWDGKPVSSEPPYGASIVVYRWQEERYEFLILHRAHRGPGYEGEWAWTPPSGARFPGEDIRTCARRELAEETGLQLELTATGLGDGDWAVFYAEAGQGDRVTLDEEHDRYLWVSLEEATGRCIPHPVNEAILGVSRKLETARP